MIFFQHKRAVQNASGKGAGGRANAVIGQTRIAGAVYWPREGSLHADDWSGRAVRGVDWSLEGRPNR